MRYDELTEQPGRPAHSTWGMFQDDAGALALIEPKHVQQAAQLVRTGHVFPLNWDVELPKPAVLGRTNLEHVVITDRYGKEDFFNNFYPQGSSQWDALCHVRHQQHGFYDGVPDDQTPGMGGYRLGIDAWARRGIAGRFVLADVARHFAAHGRPIDAAQRVAVTAAELEEVLDAQAGPGVEGDILLVRVGWIGWYCSLDQEARDRLADAKFFAAPGLAAEEAMARLIWDRGFRAVAADCPALEAMPFDQDTDEDGFLHYRLIPLLGMAIGELFDLDALADDCASTGDYQGLLVSAPLNKKGGVASTANAVALK